MSAAPAYAQYRPLTVAHGLFAWPLRLLHAWVQIPVFFFLLSLAAMLFRPPDLKAFPLDRFAFVLLVGCVALRVCIRHERLRSYPVTWPMLGLAMLGLWNIAGAPYEAQSWSLLAAKWIVPLALFHAAGIVFEHQSSVRNLELFCIAVLVYLSLTSIFFLLGAEPLIFPRFVLDSSIGLHADRARGPFLQAVANGASLNILGLIAMDSFQRRKLSRPLTAVLFVAVPLAILATKTRAVWLSAALSVALLLFSPSRRLRRAAIAFCILGAAGAGAFFLQQLNSREYAARLQDPSPVEFRSEIYEAGWQMFLEKPLLGWGNDASVQTEVARRVSTFHPDYYVFHNTFLEMAVARGVLGLGLYAWLFAGLCRLRLPLTGAAVDSEFRQLWPVILLVYLVNANAVVMNYQFVNGLLFTVAGVLAAENGRQRAQLAERVA